MGCMTFRRAISGYGGNADRPDSRCRNQSQGFFMDD
jgi:hypothetical protein